MELKKLKVCNLYCGIGGNRKLWEDVEVTAIEIDPAIAKIYQNYFPDDKVIVGDAHQYLLDHYKEFDFIWSSPPCPSHSGVNHFLNAQGVIRYPDMKLYEEIIFLDTFFKGKYVIENVKPYYEPLIKAKQIGRHLFWSSLNLGGLQMPESPEEFINTTTVEGAEKLKEWLGIHYEGNIYYDGNHCPAQVLRNCVHPVVGQQIMNRVEALI